MAEHLKIIDELRAIRESLPYSSHDPVENRELAIEQIKAIRNHLRSLGATPNIFSPITEVLHALEGLEVGRESTLLKPVSVKFSDRDRMLFTMAAAAFDFLRDSADISSKDAAKEILKIMKEYNFPDLRGRNDTERNRTDQISNSTQLENWAKACRNGRRGKTAKNYYLQAKQALKEDLQSGKGDPTEIIEQYFEMSCFGDADPYRVKKTYIS